MLMLMPLTGELLYHIVNRRRGAHNREDDAQEKHHPRPDAAASIPFPARHAGELQVKHRRKNKLNHDGAHATSDRPNDQNVGHQHREHKDAQC